MRQRPPVLAHLRFIERQAELEGLDLEALFTRIYQTNLWGDAESRSGLGSAPGAAPALWSRLGVRRILDLPCGDFAWLSGIELGERFYLGAVVAELVARNQAAFGREDGRVRFAKLDLLRDPLPAADFVLCRDCLVHLSFANIFAALANLRRSGARWLLATTFLA
jgi:hypothetical protein